MKRFLTFAVFLLVFGATLAQEERMQRVRVLVEQNKFDEALTLFRTGDLNLEERLFQSRIYHWNKKSDSAWIVLNQLIQTSTPTDEVVLWGLQLLNQSNRFTEALAWSKKYKSGFSNVLLEFIEGEIEANIGLNENDKALHLLDSISTNSAKNLKWEDWRTYLLFRSKYIAGVSYTNMQFSPETLPWQFASAEFGKRWKKGTTIIARTTVGQIEHLKPQFQGELDAYWVAKGKNSYWYANAAGAGAAPFPTVRLGLDRITENQRWSYAIGFRYLYFPKNVHIGFLTGQLGYNKKNWWLNYRPYVVYDGKTVFSTHTAYLRKQFLRREAYIQFDAQYGRVPYYYLISNDFTRLNSLRFGLSARYRITKHAYLLPSYFVEREAINPTFSRNRYTFQLFLMYKW